MRESKEKGKEKIGIVEGFLEVKKRVGSNEAGIVAGNIDNFASGIVRRLIIVYYILKRYHSGPIAENINKIAKTKTEKSIIFNLLIKNHGSDAILENIENFTDNQTERVELANSLIKSNNGNSVARHINKITTDKKLKLEILNSLLKKISVYQVAKSIHLFTDDEKIKLKMFRSLIEFRQPTQNIIDVFEKINFKPETFFDILNEFFFSDKKRFGKKLPLESFVNEFRKFDKNQTSILIKKMLSIDEYKHIPILYRNKFSNLTENSLKSSIGDDQDSLDLLEESKAFKRDLFTNKAKKYLNDDTFFNYIFFHFKLWKFHSDNFEMNNIKKLINTHLSVDYKELDETFIPSEPMNIVNIVEKKSGVEYREDFLLKFKKLHQYIQEIEKSKHRNGKDFIDAIERVRINKVNKLKNEIKDMDGGSPKKQYLMNTVSQLNSLDKLNLREYIEKSIHLLGKNLDDAVIKYLLGREIKSNLLYENIDFSVSDLSKPTVEEINRVIALCGDMLKVDGRLLKILNNWNMKSTKTKIKDVFNVKSLTEQVNTMTEISKDKTTELTCVPTRNILTEFSGHVADACWAGQYQSILESFPNLTSVFFVKDKGKQTESIQGACLLLETKDEHGGELLIIRGLNPKETFINTLDVEDFYNKVIGYLKTIAIQPNTRLAIVIDHLHEASTNRAAISRILKHKKVDLEPVWLLHPNEVYFNNYDISEEVYLVD